MDPDEFIPTRRSLSSRLKDWDDKTSWREFFDTFWRLIYGVARKAGLNDAEAQDAVQRRCSPWRKRCRASHEMYYLHVIKEQPVRDVARSLGVSKARVYLARHRLGALLRRELRHLAQGR